MNGWLTMKLFVGLLRLIHLPGITLGLLLTTTTVPVHLLLLLLVMAMERSLFPEDTTFMGGSQSHRSWVHEWIRAWLHRDQRNKVEKPDVERRRKSPLLSSSWMNEFHGNCSFTWLVGNGNCTPDSLACWTTAVAADEWLGDLKGAVLFKLNFANSQQQEPTYFNSKYIKKRKSAEVNRGRD